jgi:hypothetical protein
MRFVLTCSALVCLMTGNAFGDDSDDQLQVQTETASVDIGPRPPGLRLLKLPGMEFTLRINAHCNDDLIAESVSISVADTRVNLGPDALADLEIIEKTIRIPSKQIAPLAIENFCVADDKVGEAMRLEVRDALSAQLSLTCVGENRRSISYQTVALTVALTCKQPDGD